MLQAGSNRPINDCKATFEFIILMYYILIYFCFMKKISLKGISEILTEKELKNVLGGSGTCGAWNCYSSSPVTCLAGGGIGYCWGSAGEFCGCRTW